MSTDFWLVLAFAIPAIHLSMSVTMLWHEIVGHGLVAISLGGEFNGLMIGFDQGWCYSHVKQDDKPWKRVVHLAAGIVLTTLLGVGCFIVAWRCGHVPIMAFVLTLIGVTSVLDSGPYLFWNAVKPVPPGDMGRILAIWKRNWRGASVLRMVAIGIGGLITLPGLGLFLWMIFTQLQCFAVGSEPLVGSNRQVMVGAFVIIACAPWFLDPWEDVVPGIGVHPKLWGIVSTCVTGVVIYLYMPAVASRDNRGMITPAVVGWFWGIALAWSLVVIIWLRKGVSWSGTNGRPSSPIVKLVNMLIVNAYHEDCGEVRISHEPENGVKILMDDSEQEPFPAYLFGEVVDRVLYMAGIKKRPKSLDAPGAIITIRFEAGEARWRIASSDLSRELVLTRLQA